MDIAILGGTGDIGRGLALRWARDTTHTIHIGSRKSERAQASATEYRTLLSDRGLSGDISGFDNRGAAERARVVVLGVPPYHVRSVIDAIRDGLSEEDILVTPAVGMNRTDAGLRYDPPPTGSVTQFVRETSPDEIPVVGAFHNLPAHRLAELDDPLGIDTVILGDDDDAKSIVSDLAAEIEGLRPLDGGAISQAPEVEGITPLLVNLATRNDGMEDLGVRFT